MKHASQVKKAESQFMLVVGTIVVLIGIPAIVSFVKAPEQQMLSVQKLENRAPASIDQVIDESALPTVIERDRASTSLVKFDCERKDGSEEVHGNYVRLSGIPCKDFDDMEIINQTNGFSAAVIFTKGHKFTTDFIDLKEGENNLEITATKVDGTKISQIFKVIRRIPSSEKN